MREGPAKKELPPQIYLALYLKKSQLGRLYDEVEILKIEQSEISTKMAALRSQISQLSPEQKQRKAEIDAYKAQIAKLQDLAAYRRKAFYKVIDEYYEQAGKNTNLDARISKLRYEIDHGSQGKDEEARMKKQLAYLQSVAMQSDDYKNAVVYIRYVKKLEINLKTEFGQLIYQQKQDKNLQEAYEKNRDIFAYLKRYTAEYEKRRERIGEINKIRKQIKSQMSEAGKQ